MESHLGETCTHCEGERGAMSRVVKMMSAIALSFFVIVVPALWASWVQDGVPICTATRDQELPQVATDGAGGAIITWGEPDWVERIYAQRVDASGAVQWTENGVLICPGTLRQAFPVIVSDSAGGAIIAWDDIRSETKVDIYAQRVDASGALQWEADGVAVCTASGDRGWQEIASDGASGAIITWIDKRSGGWHVYAQRVDSLGAVQWTPDGVSIAPGVAQQFEPRIISDDAGGAIIAWDDTRTGIKTDIYARRVNASGALQWVANGVAICTASADQLHPELVSDGAGGAIITWFDRRFGYFEDDIYAQRVDSSGAVQWTGNGVPICTATRRQQEPDIVSDGVGGAIIAWQDSRGGPNWEIYAQRVDSSGAVQWTGNGVPICTTTGWQRETVVVSDSAGGAIIAWHDGRNGNDQDIYAQRVDASGAIQWTTNGVPVCTASDDQVYHQITPDDAGGAIIAWQDGRSGNNWDIYAQLIDQYGRPGGPLTGVDAPETSRIAYLAQNYPNPFNPSTTISFTLPSRMHVNLSIYDVQGRHITTLVDETLPGVKHEIRWDGRDSKGKAISSGVYFCRLAAGDNILAKKMILIK